MIYRSSLYTKIWEMKKISPLQQRELKYPSLKDKYKEQVKILFFNGVFFPCTKLFVYIVAHVLWLYKIIREGVMRDRRLRITKLLASDIIRKILNQFTRHQASPCLCRASGEGALIWAQLAWESVIIIMIFKWLQGHRINQIYWTERVSGCLPGDSSNTCNSIREHPSSTNTRTHPTSSHFPLEWKVFVFVTNPFISESECEMSCADKRGSQRYIYGFVCIWFYSGLLAHLHPKARTRPAESAAGKMDWVFQNLPLLLPHESENIFIRLVALQNKLTGNLHDVCCKIYWVELRDFLTKRALVTKSGGKLSLSKWFRPEANLNFQRRSAWCDLMTKPRRIIHF